MLKKTRNTFNNPYGIVNEDSILTIKPIILGIMPYTNTKGLNGYLNNILYLLQVRRYPETDSDYDILDLPFDILIKEENDEIDTTILSIIPNNDLALAKKIMRNINIISYCDGNTKTGIYIKKIHDGLIKKGYSEEDTKEILKQIFVLQIVDNYYENRESRDIPYATVVTIQDIYDLENPKHYYENRKYNFFRDNPFIHLKQRNNFDRLILYQSFGEGSLAETEAEHMFKENYIHAPILNSVMSLYLIRLIYMSLNNITIEDNLSIKSELDILLMEANSYIYLKNKDYNKFSKADLNDLNEYLMNKIRIIFKNYIKVKNLSNNEELYLNQKDYAIRNLSKLNNNLDINYEIIKIIKLTDEIMRYNDNYDEDDIVYIEYTNDGNIEHKKASAINKKVSILMQKTDNLINQLSSLIMPEHITSEIQEEIYIYINNTLKQIKNLVYNDKMQTIINKYCHNEETNKLHK